MLVAGRKVIRGLVLAAACHGLTACIPEPADHSDESMAMALQGTPILEQHACAVAGLNYLPGGGVLACLSATGPVCENAWLADEPARAQLLSAMDRIALTYPACAPAAALAKQDVNDLILPASHLLYSAGGTSGSHIPASSYALERIASCSQLGLDQEQYRTGGVPLADGAETAYLASAEGLVARADIGGSCRQALGSAALPATRFLQGSLSLAAMCDYGEDDLSLPDCPISANRSVFQFPGVNGW